MDWVLIILIILIPLIADIGVKSSYKKYLKVKNKKDITGQEVARQILDKNGLQDVYVVATDGYLSDHYDPTRKTVRLSKAVYEGTSVASMSIAAHECGHAIQDSIGYTPMRIRSMLVPIVNISSKLSWAVIAIGLLASLTKLFLIGIALISISLIFQLITLPVEFDASRRAKKELLKLRLIDEDEHTGVSSMLTSAAMTYVASVLTSLLEIIRLIIMFRNDK